MMKWERVSDKLCKAVGEEGTFFIERGRGFYWARYISQRRVFRLPPKKKVSEAKAMCEGNAYWE